ncbi:MAG: DUF6597 domain-containing transcriptional factor [Candidatus Krumholzibacteriia bacterium]
MSHPARRGSYREYAPCRELIPFVDCFWSRIAHPGESAPLQHRVLPDGCVDILFDVAACRQAGGRGFVVGTMTRPVVFETLGDVHLVAVRFRPGGAYPFFGLPLRELTDARVDLHELWPACGPLENRLVESEVVLRQVRLVEQSLRERLAHIRVVDGRLLGAIDTVVARPEAMSVWALGERLGMSRQHLTRRFKDYVGIGPKQLARVMRMQSVVRRIRAARALEWSAVAVDAGYYDQAHMISEFRALTGLTPGRFAASPRRQVPFFQDIRRPGPHDSRD